MSRPLDTLMQKEMTRGEFIATLGLGIASILGFSSLIHLFTGKSFSHHGISRSGLGYGSSAYGGHKEAA